MCVHVYISLLRDLAASLHMIWALKLFQPSCQPQQSRQEATSADSVTATLSYFDVHCRNLLHEGQHCNREQQEPMNLAHKGKFIRISRALNMPCMTRDACVLHVAILEF